ncbi:MAG: 23S rRNA (adenine(2503)-C(2))-methyltransferase RlmN, partial [Terricaulis sp.]
MTTGPAPKPSLAGLSKAELAEKLIAVGVEPKKAKMRVEQLWRWIYHYGVMDFDAMTNVAKELRATLSEHYTLDRPE